MDLYTLDSDFLKKDVIEGFSSIIWTERYSEPGDVSLVLPSTKENKAKLSEGTFLGLHGTKEVMLVDTALTENNQLKITGKSLLGFFDNRPIRFSVDSPTQGSSIAGTPGLLLDYLTYASVGPSDALAGLEHMGYDKNTITNLGFPRIDASVGMGDYLVEHGDETGAWIAEYPVTFGILLTALKAVADTYKLGMSMYLDSADEAGYSLIFRSYIGKDLTSDQTTYPTVQFSPALDSLSNLKELSSMAGYRNIVYVFSTAVMHTWVVDPGVAYADGAAEDSTNFNRRVLLEYVNDIKYSDDDIVEDLDNYTTYILPQLNQRAKDILANNNYVKMVDGELVPQSGYEYGVNYNLGDVIELIGRSGTKQKARITEFIRSKDNNGERFYPTVSVIE